MTYDRKKDYLYRRRRLEGAFSGEDERTERTPAQKDVACMTPDDDESLRSAHEKMTLMSRTAFHDILNLVSVAQEYDEFIAGELRKYPELYRHHMCMMRAVGGIQWNAETAGSYLSHGVPPSTWLRLQDVVREAAAAVPHDHVDLVVDVGNAEVFADELLKKVFFCLVENALSHGGKVSKIEIAFSEDEAGGRITVVDDGCGIPAQNKSRIFGQGFGSHTGMGLFFTRRALSILRFSIRENGKEGYGARFEIRVPPGLYHSRRNT